MDTCRCVQYGRVRTLVDACNNDGQVGTLVADVCNMDELVHC